MPKLSKVMTGIIEEQKEDSSYKTESENSVSKATSHLDSSRLHDESNADEKSEKEYS